MKSALKTGVSWIAVVAGIAIGVFGLAVFGSAPVLGPWTYARAWWLVAAAAIFGLCFLLSTALSLRNRNRAGLLLLTAAPVVALFVRFSQFSGSVDLLVCIAPALACVVFAGFWVLTRGWPNPLPQARLPFVAKVVGFTIITVFLTAAVSIGAISLTLWAPDIGDCGEGPPNYKPYPDYPVFVARVVHFDRFLGSVAIVQERFWNIGQHNNVVFLKALWKPGDVYFVAGRLSDGLLTRWIFPVIDMHCSRSNLIQYAAVDLRVLRAGRPQSGVRIIGRVERRRNWREVVSGAPVDIVGPQGVMTTTTDQEGIYDVQGLPPGQYEVRSAMDKFSQYASCRNYGRKLNAGEVGGCTLRVN